MNIFLAILVGIGTFILSIFGFSQIFGRINVARHQRYLKDLIEKLGGHLVSARQTAITIIIWLCILAFGCFSIHKWLFDYRIIYYTVSAISFLLSLRTGNSMHDLAEATHMKTDKESIEELGLDEAIRDLKF